MTSDSIGARSPAPPPAAAAPAQRRFPNGVAIVAGLVGLVLGALATFAITGSVWTVRVELPPPPYPPPLSQAGPGCVYPSPPSPAQAPDGIAPPLPPPPHS